jgi:hypothetical protein
MIKIKMNNNKKYNKITSKSVKNKILRKIKIIMDKMKFKRKY